MTTATVAFFAGALFSIALISRIPIWALGAWKDRSFTRLFAAHLITYVLVAVASAYALAAGAAPQWNMAFSTYALPALLVFLLDVAQMFRRGTIPHEPEAPRWFIHSGGNQKGPLPSAAVQAALAEGSVKPSDWIWRDGFSVWVQIQMVDFANNEEEKASTVASLPDKSPNYFRDHWQGALALPVSCWINGLFVSALFITPYFLLMTLVPASHSRFINAAVIALWLALIAALLWLGIGIFRSADRYATAHPNRYWGSAAKAMTIIACLAVLSIFARLGVPQIRDLADAMMAAPEKRYSLQLLRDDTELALKGPMDAGLSEAIALILKDHPSIATLDLDSPGGDQAEADRLKDIILAKSLNTYVSVSCSGSCVTVFAAGGSRWLAQGASLALHKPAIPGATQADLEAATTGTKAFLQGRGIKAEFIERGLAAPQDAVWRPTPAELFDARLATSYATDAEVATAGIPVQEIKAAETELDKTALYQVLRTLHPKAHAELLTILRDNYVRDQSVAEMRRRMWLVIGPIVNASLSSASEPALIAFYQVAVEEAKAFAKKDARSCEAFLKGRPGGFDVSVLPPPLQERELAATAELIRSSGSYAGQPIEQKNLVPAFTQVLAAAGSKGFSSAEFQQAMQFKLDPARNCAAMVLFFRSLFGMGDTDRTALLRFMAQQAATL